MKYAEVVSAWNAQADDANSWDELGDDEKIGFATALEREACAKVCEATMSEAIIGGDEEYNTGREIGAAVCATKIRMRSNA
jgi:hypothetical protein